MFTGIVEEVGRVTVASPGGLTIAATDTLRGMGHGASIAVNGACLTITTLGTGSFSVDVMPETMKRTVIGTLRVGDKVNLERPLVLGGHLGGHLVQGHVDDTARLTSVVGGGGATVIRLETSPWLMRYVVEKGFVAVDGVSLTVVARDNISFQVSLVGYTREHTTLGNRRVGDLVNLEVDIIAKYVEQLGQGRSPGVTFEFLKEHGFSVS